MLFQRITLLVLQISYELEFRFIVTWFSVPFSDDMPAWWEKGRDVSYIAFLSALSDDMSACWKKCRAVSYIAILSALFDDMSVCWENDMDVSYVAFLSAYSDDMSICWEKRRDVSYIAFQSVKRTLLQLINRSSGHCISHLRPSVVSVSKDDLAGTRLDRASEYHLLAASHHIHNGTTQIDLR